MAKRHKRYDRAARLSRRAASAAFDATFDFFTPEAAQDAAEKLWERAKVKARAVGNVVHYENPRSAGEDDDREAFVYALLKDLLDAEVDKLYESGGLYDTLVDKAQADWADDESLSWGDPDDDFDDDEGEEWKQGLVGMEPELEEPGAGYEPPPRQAGPWKPRGEHWVDLVLDYAKLPDYAGVREYAKRTGMIFRDDETLVDIAEASEGKDTYDGQLEFIAALYEMMHRGLDEYGLWWDYLRAYDYAQEHKPDAGAARMSRREINHGPAAEAARRSSNEKR